MVRFAWPVDGLDPIDGEEFRADRHRVAAARAQQDPKDTTFITSQGEIVARWDTAAITSILWPSSQVFDPPAPEEHATQQGAPPESNNPVGSREWLDDVKRSSCLTSLPPDRLESDRTCRWIELRQVQSVHRGG